MNRKFIQALALTTATLGLGVSMPSCPGQQAMQQQIDALQASRMELTRKLNTLEPQVKTLAGEMEQAKQLLAQMTNAIQAQKTSMDQLDASVKEIQSKLPAAKGAKGKTATPPAPKKK